MVLDKKATMFERDEAGKLLPKEVTLVIDETDKDQKTLKGETVVIIPLRRGELRRIFATVADEKEESDLDGKLMLQNCINPSFTEEEIKDVKGYFANAIVNTILHESGLDVKKSRKQALQDKEDEFAKN